jgi:hypothetical protein
MNDEQTAANTAANAESVPVEEAEEVEEQAEVVEPEVKEDTEEEKQIKDRARRLLKAVGVEV